MMRIKRWISNTSYLLTGIWVAWTITAAHTIALGASIVPIVIVLVLCSLDGEGWEELRGGWFD